MAAAARTRSVFETPEIVIFDTEYTSWEGCIDRGWDESRGEYRELVQLAAIVIRTDDFNEHRAFDRLVRPRINPDLSDYFIDLTGIDQSKVDEAEPFESVAHDFHEWSGALPVYSYGNDVDVLQRNVELHDADLEFDESRFHDVRLKFKTAGVPVDEYTSGTVSEYFDAAPSDGDPHNALYNCRSIAQALAAV